MSGFLLSIIIVLCISSVFMINHNMPYAPSRLRRFASMMYEGVLIFGVVFIAGYLFDTLSQSKSGLYLRHSRQIIMFIVIGIYFIICWRKNGQTLPMKTWNIRLTDRNGQPLSLQRMIIRYILLWPIPLIATMGIYMLSHATQISAVNSFIVIAPFTIFIWTWFDPQGQFLHDRLLGTELHSVAKHSKSAS